MKELLNVIRRFWLVAMGTLLMLFIMIFEMTNKYKSAKYIIYAADRRYEANQFQVCGKTIYFADARTKHHICITGEYTLIYETVPEE